MDRVLEFLWRGLIGTGKAGRVGDKVDLDIPLGRDVSGLLVVGKVIAIDLVEAGGVAAIEHDADVVQFGVAVELELFEIAGLDGKERPLSVGFGKLKAASGLLDVIPNLARDLFQHVRRLRTRVEIHPRHDQREQHSGQSQQTAQAIDLERHLGSV